MTESAAGAGGFDWRHAGDHVRVLLSDVAVDVRIGLHPWERHPERPTRLIVNVEMFAAWPLAQGDFIDYDRVRDHISGWRGRDHVELLETLVEELIGVCDRIYVMAKGRISGELARKDFSQENIMKLALRG